MEWSYTNTLCKGVTEPNPLNPIFYIYISTCTSWKAIKISTTSDSFLIYYTSQSQLGCPIKRLHLCHVYFIPLAFLRGTIFVKYSKRDFRLWNIPLVPSLPPRAPGHFAERHLADRHFADGHFAKRTFCQTDILPNGQFDERAPRRKDTSPKRQPAENREILAVVTHFSKMCNPQSLCNYKITIVWSLPYTNTKSSPNQQLHWRMASFVWSSCCNHPSDNSSWSVLARIPQVPPKKKYQVINERLKKIFSEFDTYENMITYCRTIANYL